MLGSLFVPAGVLSPSITGKDAASLFRVSNAISYLTPGDLGGFSGQLQFAPSEQSSNAGLGDKDGRVITVRLAIDKGPIGFSVSAGESKQSGVGVSQDVSTANVGG